MAKLAVDIIGDASSLQRAFLKAGASANTFDRRMSHVGTSTRRSISGLVRGVGIGFLGGVGIVGAISSTIGKAAEFQSSMNLLQAVTHATGRQMKAAAAEATKLGADITLPATSAKDAAGAMTELAKGGLNVTSSMAAAKGTLQLAAAAQIGAADAAKIQVNALNQFHLSGSKASLVADVLANSANAASGEITDMATALTYVGPVAASVGENIKNTGTSIALLAKNGILGDQAGTGLRSMIVRLAKPTKQGQEGIDRLGISAFDAKGKFVGFRAVIEQLHKAQGKLTQQQFAMAAAQAFGKEPLSAIVALARAGAPGFDKMAEAVGKQGGAARISAARNKGFKGAMDGLKSSVETLQIQLGSVLLPVLTRYVRAASTWLSSTRNQQTIMTTFRTVLGTVAGVMKTLHGVIVGLNAVTGSYKNTLKLLLGAFIAFKTAKLASSVFPLVGGFQRLARSTGDAAGAQAAASATAGRTSASYAALTAQITRNTAALEANAAASKLSLGTGLSTATSARKAAASTEKLGAAASGSITKVSRLRGGMSNLARAAGRLTATPYLITFTMVAIGAKIIANKIKDLQQQALAARDATFEKGAGVETTLVPSLAKKITALKGQGLRASAILPILRKQLGGSLKADDLIAEAFAFHSGTDATLTKRIDTNVTKRIHAASKRLVHATRLATSVDKPVVKAAVGKSAAELAAQSNSFFDTRIGRELDRVQDVTGFTGQLRALSGIAGKIRARIAATKDVTRQLNLEDQLLGVVRQQRDLRAQKADADKAAADAAKQKRADQVAALLDSLQFGFEKAQATKGIGDDLKALDKIEAAIKAQIKKEGSTTDLQRQLFQVRQQRVDVRAQAAQDRKDAAQAAAEKKKAQAAKLEAARSARGFRALGLTATGDTITPGVANLRKRLGNISQAVQGTFLDTGKTKSLLAGVKKALTDSLAPQDVRAKVKEMLDGVNDELKSHAGEQTKFAHTSSANFVKSLGLQGLTRDERRRIQARFAQVGRGGTVPGQTGQFAGARGTHIVMHNPHFHGVTDPRAFEETMEKRQRSRPQVRRGAR